MTIEQKINREIALFFKTSAKKQTVGTVKRNLSYHEFLADKMLIIAAIRSGIPYSLFAVIKDLTPFSESDWAEFLNLSTKSLQRLSLIHI